MSKDAASTSAAAQKKAIEQRKKRPGIESRARTLLRKVLPAQEKEAAVLQPREDGSKGFAFDALDVTLLFEEGTSSAEDAFSVLHKGQTYPKVIRTFTGLEQAIVYCALLSDLKVSNEGAANRLMYLHTYAGQRKQQDIWRAPGPMEVASVALTAYAKCFQFSFEPAKTEHAYLRAKNALAKILGANADCATLAPDAEYGEIYFDVDDMQLEFLLGATPDDDCFRVTFLNAPSPRPVRTAAGLGMALSEILGELRITGEFIAENKGR
jgi:hypothetical protein